MISSHGARKAKHDFLSAPRSLLLILLMQNRYIALVGAFQLILLSIWVCGFFVVITVVILPPPPPLKTEIILDRDEEREAI